MSNQYTQSVTSGKTRFTAAPMGEIEYSIMHDNPTHLTTFNGGEIVPIYVSEVLPHDTFSMDLDFVIRQTTSLVPVMGQLVADFYAFFVPNRVVNQSWKNVMGENSSGEWSNNPEITLAPLLAPNYNATTSIKFPVGSVGDYYGFPTQLPIPVEILKQCHDLKFRGYLDIYNNYFRDQNFQPPIPYSKLNVNNGWLYGENTPIDYSPEGIVMPAGTKSDGQYGFGAVQKALGGEGSENQSDVTLPRRKTSFSALGGLLKANKLHDYFTSGLPSPQRGRTVTVGNGGLLPVDTSKNFYAFTNGALHLGTNSGGAGQQPDSPNSASQYLPLGISKLQNSFDNTAKMDKYALVYNPSGVTTLKNNNGAQVPQGNVNIDGSNLAVDTSQLTISLDDLRLSAAMQTAYEVLGRGGGRYVEFINSFFGIEVDNPFDDIPTLLGHFRRDLDLYQTAQTSASQPVEDGKASTPQGNLSAFGYTNKSGSLFTKTFVEHGYIHVFAVVRHRNVYSSLLSRDNFRLSMFDFYSYPFANISEQPVYTREINPFSSKSVDGVFNYQEAWAEYRMEPDRVSGFMRAVGYGQKSPESLAYWNYADYIDSSLESCNGEWLESNTDEIVARSTAPEELALPQFKAQFMFNITKQRPMPVYSVPGLDIF